MSTLIILGSARKDSHTRTLVQNVFADTPHELVDLLDFNISTFDYEADYSKSDEYFDIIGKMTDASTIVFATPVYWYSMSGMMKTFFDRFTDLTTFASDKGKALAGKKTFLFSVGADPEPPTGFESPFELTSKALGMKYIEGVYFSSRGDQFTTIASTASSFLKKIAQSV
ncbi:MAG: NAD(P)H-dependent oxidoreductase [Flavobacteriales bacterium]|nr:NAD(P)H-dependent oxidoreductase [Flavobacteriales bacterium]